MDNHNSNTNVPTTRSQMAAFTPMTEHDLVLPALDGRWLDQLTPFEIDCLLERRAPLLHSMLLASDDDETQFAICVIDAAASYLSDGIGHLSDVARRGRRSFLRHFLKVTFGDVASEIGRRKELGGAIVAATDDSAPLPRPVPSIEQLQALGAHLKASQGDRWEFLVYLTTVVGLTLGEAFALRFDSFQRDVDGSWVVHIEDSLRDGGRSRGDLVKNRTSRSVMPPPQLVKRMFELFGEQMGASSAFVFAAEGQKEPRPQRVLGMLGSAMSRLGWSEDLFRSPGRALRAAWLAHGDSVADSFRSDDDCDGVDGEIPPTR